MGVVCFDLGGVIVDVDHGVVERRLAITRAELELAFFGDARHDALTIGALSGDDFVRAAAQLLDRPHADVRSAWRDVVAVTPAGRVLVEECLAADLEVWLWSNTDPIHLEKMAAGLPASPRVRLESVSFQIGAMKPNAEFYTRNLALLEGARDIVFVDDRADNVAAAVALGVRAHRVDGPAQARAALVATGLLE